MCVSLPSLDVSCFSIGPFTAVCLHSPIQLCMWTNSSRPYCSTYIYCTVGIFFTVNRELALYTRKWLFIHLSRSKASNFLEITEEKIVQYYFVPGRCVPVREVSDVSSLGHCLSWMMRPLVEASLNDVSWSFGTAWPYAGNLGGVMSWRKYGATVRM
jgi:hypothetical protein